MISNAVPRTVGIEPGCDYFGKQSLAQTTTVARKSGNGQAATLSEKEKMGG
jgi:hypothetical protein